MTDGGNIDNEIIKSSFELVNKAYPDALQPLAKETGKALGTLGKAVNVALMPLRGAIWAFDKFEHFIIQSIEEKLKQRKTSPENIVPPNPDIAIPSIQALQYTQLKDQFVNLVASSMDENSRDFTHPSFVEILKQISPVEAAIIQALPPSQNKYHPLITVSFESSKNGRSLIYSNLSPIHRLVSSSDYNKTSCQLENLSRLGIIDITYQKVAGRDEAYKSLIESLNVPLTSNSDSDAKTAYEQGVFYFTQFGLTFRKACISHSSDSATNTANQHYKEKPAPSVWQ